MLKKIERPRFRFEFDLLWLGGINDRLFLRSEKPEEVILAILADFGQTPSEPVILDIIHNLTVKAASDLDRERYWAQLRILADLRNFGVLIETLMDSVSTFFVTEKEQLGQN